jgi:hypothetical protein
VTEQEAEQFYAELQKHYGDKLANPEHHPKIFQYQVTLYKYTQELKNETIGCG